MSEKVVVPEERKKRIIARANEAMHGPVEADEAAVIIDAFAEDIAEHPIVPTDEQVEAFETGPTSTTEWARRWAVEFQRHMFDAPEPEVPEEIADLAPAIGTPHREEWIAANAEAYRRGQKAGSK